MIILALTIKNIDDYLRVKITKQFSRAISFQNANLDFKLRCANSIQVTEETFYLRGSSKTRDLEWTGFSKQQGLKILSILREFSVSNGFKIDVKVSKDGIYILITSDPPFGDEIYDLDALYSQMCNLKSVSMMEAEHDNMDSKTCDVCAKSAKKLIKLKSGFSVITACEKCKDKLKQCESCECLYENLNDHTNSLGTKKKVCKSCYSFAICPQCGFKELKSDLVTRIFYNDMTASCYGKNICLKCNEGNIRCDICNSFRIPDEEDCPCSIPKDFKSLIFKFDEDVTNHLPMDSDCRVGLEIEVGVHCKHRRRFLEVHRHTKELIGQDAIMVYDSSIDYKDRGKEIMNDFRGFEIVTRPLNLQNAKRFINNFAKNRHELLESWEVGTTGLHIHHSRKLLTRIEIGKLLLFINSPKNRKLIKFVARRYSSKFAKLSAKKITDYKRDGKECHYEGLNTNKKFTVEFRIFRGSISRKILLSYLEFVISTVEFIKHTAPRELTSDVYLKWLYSTDRSSYRELKAHLKNFNVKGYVMEGGDK